MLGKNYYANSVNYLMDLCHTASKEAGWWNDGEGKPLQANPFIFSNKLALIHSELSECLEGDRKGLADDKLPHRSMREVELADALIRLLDLAGAYDMDLGGAMVEKMEYNRTRLDHKIETRNGVNGKKY